MTSAIPTAISAFFEGSQIPLSMSDPNQPDDPMILANEAFYRMSGYGPDEVLGKNCHFLQGPQTRQNAVKTIRGDFTANRETRVLIRNHRKNGDVFDNYLFIFRIMDSRDRLLFRIGSQFEVPIINRNAAFETYTEELLGGLNAINDVSDIARQQLINTGELVGLTIKSLLQARLEGLKAV